MARISETRVKMSESGVEIRGIFRKGSRDANGIKRRGSRNLTSCVGEGIGKKGKRTGKEVWSELKASNRVGVTRGSMEERRNPLTII